MGPRRCGWAAYAHKAVWLRVAFVRYGALPPGFYTDFFFIDFCGKFRWFFKDLEAGDITIEFAKKIMPIHALNSIL